MHQGVLKNESLADTTSDVCNSIHDTDANVNSNSDNSFAVRKIQKLFSPKKQN